MTARPRSLYSSRCTTGRRTDSVSRSTTTTPVILSRRRTVEGPPAW